MTQPEQLPAPLPASLADDLEELGLSPYEARVLLALLQLGSGNTFQLARISGVPRSSNYHILEALANKRVAVRLPGDGPAVWACPSRDEVIERLVAAQEEELRLKRLRAAQVRETLDRLLPEAPAVGLPYVHHLRGAAYMKQTYEQLMGQARSEVVMFTRPPYTWGPGEPNPAVVDALERGIATRVLYEATEWEDPASAEFRYECRVYHDAGVQARLADELPIKVVVVDRQIALVNMADPVLPGGYPTTLLVEHPGFAAFAAKGFEMYWASARSIPEEAPSTA